MSTGDLLPYVVAAIFYGVVYLAPSFVAYNRRAPNAAGIFALNLFLGWTFVGWVIALIWALNRTKTEP